MNQGEWEAAAPVLQPGEQATGPHGTRLLSGWFTTGVRAGLAEHLAAYGPPPLPQTGRPAAALIRAVDEAGLTGRGGAAFPTGRKLRTVAEARGTAVVIANGMESEAASRKDSTLLDVAPHLVLDGASLAAAAVGADEINICLARTRGGQFQDLQAAVAERARAGLDPVPITLHGLPHHYVSSEETSLVNWLGSGEARPLATPPRPFEKGVKGRPTLIDNVETLAHLALIVRYGPDWFRSVGRPDAPGTSLVTLSGAVRTPGVYEIPLGTTLAALVQTAGGATRPLRALLVGGYFGSWLPADQVQNLPYTKPDLATVGAGPGAGVLFALPDNGCGLSETAQVVEYLARQSAQQCGPCRFGLPAVAADFATLAWGRPEAELVARLRQRAGLLAGRGACRHPDGASRLAATALEVFADDVHRHLTHQPCPGSRAPRLLHVPDTPGPEQEGWR